MAQSGRTRFDESCWSSTALVRHQGQLAPSARLAASHAGGLIRTSPALSDLLKLPETAARALPPCGCAAGDWLQAHETLRTVRRREVAQVAHVQEPNIRSAEIDGFLYRQVSSQTRLTHPVRGHRWTNFEKRPNTWQPTDRENRRGGTEVDAACRRSFQRPASFDLRAARPKGPTQ